MKDIDMSRSNYKKQIRRQTLDELLGRETVPNLDFCLDRECAPLLLKPIGELSPESLRLLIGKGVGVVFLVPLAVEALEQEPLIATTYYPGDLLCAVLRVEASFWAQRPELRDRVTTVVSRVPSSPLVDHPLVDWRRRWDAAPQVTSVPPSRNENGTMG
jgi:hypothetical protein